MSTESEERSLDKLKDDRKQLAYRLRMAIRARAISEQLLTDFFADWETRYGYCLIDAPFHDRWDCPVERVYMTVSTLANDSDETVDGCHLDYVERSDDDDLEGLVDDLIELCRPWVESMREEQ